MKIIAIVFLVVLLLTGCTLQETERNNEVPPTKNLTDEDIEGEAEGQNQTTSLPAANVTNDSMTANTSLQEYNFTNVTTGGGRLIIYYFHSTGCVASKALNPEVDRLELEYPEALFLRYDIATQNGSSAYNGFAEQYNLSTDKRLVPQVLVNGTIITDRFNINESLENIIQDYTA